MYSSCCHANEKKLISRPNISIAVTHLHTVLSSVFGKKIFSQFNHHLFKVDGLHVLAT